MTTITHTPDGPRFDGMTVGELIAYADQQSALCQTMHADGRANVLDRFAAALRHLSEWQPIETAPRDGREIDIWVVPPSRHEPGDYPIYAGACSQRIPNVRPCYTHAWQDDHGRAVTGRRFYDDGDQCIDPDDISELASRATHWRPLPPGPMEATP